MGIDFILFCINEIIMMIWKNNEDKKKKTRRQENNKDAGDLRRRRLHYDVIVMPKVTPGINSLISISTTKASICECISSAYSDLVKKEKLLSSLEQQITEYSAQN